MPGNTRKCPGVRSRRRAAGPGRRPAALSAFPFLAALMLLTGCQPQSPANVIELTRQSSDAQGPVRLRWQASRVLFVPDSRGQARLLAEHQTPPGTGLPVRQWLTVRLLWQVDPTYSGTDPSALNAIIGYLVRTDPQSGEPALLYYEGAGNVLTDKAAWWTGGTEFTIRHAFLRLTRSNRSRSVDPLGTVELSGRLIAAADPEAAPAIEQVGQMVDDLPPPADDPPATMPDLP